MTSSASSAQGQLNAVNLHMSLPQRFNPMKRYDVNFDTVLLKIPAITEQAALPYGVPDGTTVITLQADGAEVQVLSCQSMLTLGVTVFKFTLEKTRQEGVHDHLWLFRLPEAEDEDDDEGMAQLGYMNFMDRERRIEADTMGRGRAASEYSLAELGLAVGMQFIFEYDYGTTSSLQISVVKIEPLDRSVTKLYPCQVLDHLPQTTTADDVLSLDELYPDLTKYLFGDNISTFVLGNWSRVNFGFAYQILADQNVLVAPFRFKTMDELFVLGNKAASEMTYEETDTWSVSSHFIIPHHGLSPKQEGSFSDLSTTAHRFAFPLAYMEGSAESHHRYTPAQWQATLAGLKALQVEGKRVKLFAKRFPKTSKALTTGTHWLRVERERLLLACKGKCKTSMVPNDENVIKTVRHHFTSLDELFTVVESAL
eukprot:m.47005 g.47005  ORF g.47005 m.47005 type:complete len:425 (+) comp13192_c0_seq1:180-1454(+)